MTTIGNYIIEQTLSESGTSKVYVARHKVLGRTTLLKVYSGGDETLIRRFEREAKIVADLNSDAIVAIYDFGEDNGAFFISMEYVNGHNLEGFLKQRALNDEELINFCYQIACCAGVLHSKNYIHRDLKPENILVTSDERIKLTDFGITLQESLNRVTSDGALLGTPLYMSPEQINNLTLTIASDVFAMGVIFYQIAAQIHPFDAPNYGEVFSRILTHQPQSVLEFRPDLPQWFADLTERMLIKDARKRPQSAAEIIAVFESNQPELKLSRAPQSTMQKPKRASWIRPIAALITIMLIGLGVIFLPGILNTPGLETNNNHTLDDSLNVNSDLNNTDQNRQNPSDSLLYAAKNRLVNADRERSNNARNIPDPENTRLSTILINAFPYCKIYLDYRLIDETPMTQPLEVKPGRYLLGLQNPNYPSFTDSITVMPSSANVFNYNLDTAFVRLNLDVRPWGNVYIDGKLIGMTPLQKSVYLTRMRHILEVRNDNYETWSDTLFCSGQSELNRFIVLKETTLGIKDKE